MALTVDGGLTGKLLQHLGGTGESITRLANGDVENELLNAELPHGVRALVLRFGLDITYQILFDVAGYSRSRLSPHLASRARVDEYHIEHDDGSSDGDSSRHPKVMMAIT